MSATFQFTDLVKAKAASPTDDDHIARKKYVDDTYLAGQTRQVVNTQTGAVNTGTTQIPNDDTIPQITEGDEYMTRAITPTHADNKLRIDVICIVSAGSSSLITAGLFQDTTANALACASEWTSSSSQILTVKFTHYMAAGTTSETTFRVRAGHSNAGTTTFNGAGGARKMGGVFASSITITETKQ